MNKLMLGLGGACVLAVAAGGLPASAVPIKPADVAEPTKWECAELRMTTHVYWNAAATGEDEPKPEIVLYLPDKSHKTDAVSGLPLGRKPNQDTAAGVLTALGQDGWEAVGFAATEWVNPGRAIKRTEAWTLKRPAKK